MRGILSKFSLEGQVALVTGAGRGIGFELAKALSQAGAVIVVNDLAQETAGKAAAAIRADGGDASVRAFDVTDEAAGTVAVDSVVAEFGRLDILVNNAGILIRKPIADHAMTDFRAVIEVNLNSAYMLARQAARVMRPQGRGRIINIGSVMSLSSRDGIVSYVASKHAILGLTRAMAAELGRSGITVNAIGPGYILTPINDAIVADSRFHRTIEERTPLGRWAQPEELAGAAVFLASPAADFVTGQLLMVDGGITSNTLLTTPGS